MPIYFSPSDVSAIRSEIARLYSELDGIDDQIQFANDQLNGTDAEYLYTADELRNKPYLKTDQQLLLPAQIGVLQKDAAYKNLMDSSCSAIPYYEAEGKLLYGTYPVWTSTSNQIIILKNTNLGTAGNIDITNTLNNPKWLIYGMRDATASTNPRGAIKTVRGDLIVSHTAITISDGVHVATVFEFCRSGEVETPGNYRVEISDSDVESTIATNLNNAINAAPNLDILSVTNAFDLFDESMVQTSGVGRIAPLFNPAVDAINPVNPGQLFGGTGAFSPVETTYIDTELAKIAYLATGYCQVQDPLPPPPHIPANCQTARADLEVCLEARYDPLFMAGLLKQEENAIVSNPDLLLFPINPLTAVQAEISRITAFLNNLSGIPVTDPIPPAILTANQTAATNRKNYLLNTRIPEMNIYLNGTNGYYPTRYRTLQFRVSGSGTLQEVNFWQGQIVYLNDQKAAIRVQIYNLESMLPV